MLKRPYRIAVVIPKYGLVGGGERFAAEVTARVAENPAFEIHVFANKWRSNSPYITFHRVPIISFPRFLVTPSFAFFANRIIDNCSCSGFDLIHTHDRIFRADIFTMHGIPHRAWVSEVRRKRMSFFDRTTAWVEEHLVRAGGCSLFLTVSKLAGARFEQMYPVAPGRVECMAPGVSLEQFPLGEKRQSVRCSVRARYGIGLSESVILFVGMNFELKGLDRLITAMAKLAASDPAAARPKLLVVGKGNQKKFSQLAHTLGIGNEVLFVGVVENDVEEMFLASDVFVMLSDFDTFGMVVLEAMAASLPVIVSERVGAKDLVREGENGFVVDRDDIVTVGRRIQYVLETANRERLGFAARCEAEKHTWSQAANRLCEIYKFLLARGK